LHFGLGTADKVDRIEIVWPSGSKETIQVPSVDKIYAVEEGRGIVQP